MLTATVAIDNGDNVLTQTEWSDYVQRTRSMLEGVLRKITHNVGSAYDDPGQVCVWIGDLDESRVEQLYEVMREIREQFRQESVSVTVGDTVEV